MLTDGYYATPLPGRFCLPECILYYPTYIRTILARGLLPLDKAGQSPGYDAYRKDTLSLRQKSTFRY